MKTVLLAMGFALFLGSGTTAWAQDAVRSIDGFIERLNSGLGEGGDYSGFRELVDPKDEFRSAMNAVISAITTETNGAPLDFVPMFLEQTQPTGAKLIGVVHDDGKIALFIAVVLAEINGNWRVMRFTVESSYEKLLPYH
ncbi:MAG: hypothetical protein AAFN79_05275 [Pseudomonadota bacterium]